MITFLFILNTILIQYNYIPKNPFKGKCLWLIKGCLRNQIYSEICIYQTSLGPAFVFQEKTGVWFIQIKLTKISHIRTVLKALVLQDSVLFRVQLRQVSLYYSTNVVAELQEGIEIFGQAVQLTIIHTIYWYNLFLCYLYIWILIKIM